MMETGPEHTARLSLVALGADELERLLPLTECVELMQKALIAISDARTKVTPRMKLATPGDVGTIGMMSGGVAGIGHGVKLVSFFPGNMQRGLSTHAGVYLLYGDQDGVPVCMMDAGRLTAIRTAAATVAATLALARPDARRLLIIGAGEQAERHAAALPAACNFEQVLVWARRPQAAEALAGKLKSRVPMIAVARDLRAAAAGADVICTCTSAHDPVLDADWIAQGAHINLVGSSFVQFSELDPALLPRARYFVDSHASALEQAGELRRAMAAGLGGVELIAGEIGSVLGGALPGRVNAKDITIFKSLGHAAEDVFAARYAYDAAIRQGSGSTFVM